VPLKDDLRRRSPREQREERDDLGFLRMPAVRWLSPLLLARLGVEVIVSGTFGRFADKREIQREQQDPLDYSGAGELWLDYLSDTGDGWEATYTMAWLLAQPSLHTGGRELPRAKVLLLGGDQVYPSAAAQAYEDRFEGPFRSALPQTAAGSEPHMYVTPGNHDWSDGLSSFLRMFCARAWIGGWRTRQRRSYFALRLPSGWWVWAIDIQLDTYIDDVQLDYFRSQPIGIGDKVILVTAKPAWVQAYPGRAEPAPWRYLSFFEERMVRARGARLVLTLTGDSHHYARYEPTGAGADDAPTRITAGGGGAYLSATHTLQPELDLRSLDRDRSVAYTRDEIYPSERVSRRLSSGVLRLALHNPSFAALLGVVYLLLAVALLRDAEATTVLLSLGLLAATYGATDIRPEPLQTDACRRILALRSVVAAVQTGAHLLLVAAVVWATRAIVPGQVAEWVLGLLATFAAGASAGTTIFAAFLLAVHRVRGSKAPASATHVFAAQSIADHKNLLRMHVGPDGGLRVYPLGVERACRDWRYAGDEDDEGPRFVPSGPAPQAHPIDGPLEFDRMGTRLY